MASRYEVEVKIASARNLKNVNWRHGANRPYAVVWVDPKNKCSTRVDEDGDTEANWDQTLLIPLPVGPIEDFTLYIDIVHAGSEEETKPLIGSARLKLADVVNDVGTGERSSRTLTLKRPSGRPQGKVGVNVTIKDNSYRAPGGYYAPPYGVPPQAAQSRDYTAEPPAYGYAYAAHESQGSYYSAAPPPSSGPPSGYPYGGYNAPPQTASYEGGSYGYAAPVPEEKKKSKFGGMGTGLAVGVLAGAVGGIALMEGAEYLEDKIVDDVAEKVEEDLGYDDDDGGYDGDDL